MASSLPNNPQPDALPEIARQLGDRLRRPRQFVVAPLFLPAVGRSGPRSERESRLRGPSAFAIRSFRDDIDERQSRRARAARETEDRRDPAGESVLAFFDMRSEREVRRFLRENTPVLAVLAQALAEVSRVFGPLRPRLELFQNPEEASDRKLFVSIPCALNVESAMALLQRLDEAWWNNASAFYGDRLAVDVEGA